MTGILLNT